MFQPVRVIIEEKALEYPRGKELLEEFQAKNIETKIIKGSRVSGIPGKTTSEMYYEGKNTLVVGVRKELDFQSCKPSAHYMLPLVSGCIGMCEYCYLNTQLGKRPYTKIYVNVEEILQKADAYMEARKPEVTVFEGAATSDPIPVERYSQGLEKAIIHFGKNPYAKFRFVTKFTDVNSLLNLPHEGRTTIRFSVNTNWAIKKFEHKVPKMEERIEAAFKVSQGGYPIGFIIAPVFLYDTWKEEYLNLITLIGEKFKGTQPSFEIITHRYTKRAKERILETFPNTKLPMEEEKRKFKMGQFGYGKYVYGTEELQQVKEFFITHLSKYFDAEAIRYII